MTSLTVIVMAATVWVGAEAEPETADQFVDRGMQRFRAGEIAESLGDFDRAIEKEPRVRPYLWQRGISLYYLGKYAEGREQFETHRSVNPHDVENAAWHFLCVAQQSGIKAAREALIPIETSKDTRVPMAEVYEYYAGRKSAQDVLDAADKDDGARAKMYAELYLGLLDEVADRQPQARQHLANAAKVKMEAHYMQDVAKVHVRLRKWNP